MRAEKVQKKLETTIQYKVFDVVALSIFHGQLPRWTMKRNYMM